MYCCAECFTSPILKEHINSEGTLDTCELCGSTKVKTVDSSDLYELFKPLFDLYREIQYGIDYIEEEDPTDKGETLPQLLQQDWYDIFSEKANDNMYDDFFESVIGGGTYDKHSPDDGPPDLSTLYTSIDDDYSGELWWRLREYLMHERRFSIKDERIAHFIDTIQETLLGLETKVRAGQTYYRARLDSGERDKPLPCEEMGTPPPEKVTEGGRANPAGIPVLYLADDEKTAISEVRPWKGAAVTVGTFKTTKGLTLADLTGKFFIEDPFAYGETLSLVIDEQKLLRRLARELAKPVNPGKANIDYVPTQFLTEIIRNHDYDGMIYPSALAKGKNVVLFQPESANCEDTKLYQVDSVDYQSSPYDPEREYWEERLV